MMIIITTIIPIVAPRLRACFILDLRESIESLVAFLRFNKFVTKLSFHLGNLRFRTFVLIFSGPTRQLFFFDENHWCYS